MSDKEKQLYKALVKIAEVASIAVNGDEHADHTHYVDDVHDDDYTGEVRVCTPKALPKRLLLKAAETARSINPVNAPMFAPLAALASPS